MSSRPNPEKDRKYHRQWRSLHKDSIATAQRTYRQTLKGRIQTQEKRSRRYRAVREWLHNYKEDTPCTDCHEFFPHFVMDFDHVKGTKRGNMSMMIGGSNKRLLDEIAKCELVCANCHKIRTYARLCDC